MADGFTYHGIEKLALISEAISGMFECTRDQLDNFRQLKPGTLDDATLHRVKNLYVSEAELYPYFTRQLIRWSNLDLTNNQQGEVQKLQSLHEETQKMGDEILRICKKFENQTIEKLFGKDDFELAFDYLIKNHGVDLRE